MRLAPSHDTDRDDHVVVVLTSLNMNPAFNFVQKTVPHPAMTSVLVRRSVHQTTRLSWTGITFTIQNCCHTKLQTIIEKCRGVYMTIVVRINTQEPRFDPLTPTSEMLILPRYTCRDLLLDNAATSTSRVTENTKTDKCVEAQPIIRRKTYHSARNGIRMSFIWRWGSKREACMSKGKYDHRDCKNTLKFIFHFSQASLGCSFMIIWSYCRLTQQNALRARSQGGIV
jgi:hypothetical protein